jgi:hypothetical protein
MVREEGEYMERERKRIITLSLNLNVLKFK